MEITIKGDPKEIAALVLKIQERQIAEQDWKKILSDSARYTTVCGPVAKDCCHNEYESMAVGFASIHKGHDVYFTTASSK